MANLYTIGSLESTKDELVALFKEGIITSDVYIFLSLAITPNSVKDVNRIISENSERVNTVLCAPVPNSPRSEKVALMRSKVRLTCQIISMNSKCGTNTPLDENATFNLPVSTTPRPPVPAKDLSSANTVVKKPEMSTIHPALRPPALQINTGYRRTKRSASDGAIAVTAMPKVGLLFITCVSCSNVELIKYKSELLPNIPPSNPKRYTNGIITSTCPHCKTPSSTATNVMNISPVGATDMLKSMTINTHPNAMEHVLKVSSAFAGTHVPIITFRSKVMYMERFEIMKTTRDDDKIISLGQGIPIFNTRK